MLTRRAFIGALLGGVVAAVLRKAEPAGPADQDDMVITHIDYEARVITYGRRADYIATLKRKEEA